MHGIQAEILKNADEDVTVKELKRCAVFVWRKEKNQRLD